MRGPAIHLSLECVLLDTSVALKKEEPVLFQMNVLHVMLILVLMIKLVVDHQVTSALILGFVDASQLDTAQKAKSVAQILDVILKVNAPHLLLPHVMTLTVQVILHIVVRILFQGVHTVHKTIVIVFLTPFFHAQVMLHAVGLVVNAYLMIELKQNALLKMLLVAMTLYSVVTTKYVAQNKDLYVMLRHYARVIPLRIV